MNKRGGKTKSTFISMSIVFGLILVAILGYTGYAAITSQDNISAVSPADGAVQWVPFSEINFNCSAAAADDELGNVSIWSNITGTNAMQLINDSGTVSGNGTLFNANFTLTGANVSENASFGWSCRFEVLGGAINWSTNSTLKIDTQTPTLFNFTNVTYGAQDTNYYNNTVSRNLTPRFDWNATSDLSFQNYSFHISNDTTFDSTDVIVSGITLVNETYYQVTSDLNTDVVYYISVIAHEIDAALSNRGNSSTNITEEFWVYTTDNSTPVVQLLNVSAGDAEYNTVSNEVWSRYANVTLWYNASDVALDVCVAWINTTGEWAENNSIGYNLTTSLNQFNTYEIYPNSLVDGTYLFNAYCNDTLNSLTWAVSQSDLSAAASNITFHIDTTAPTGLFLGNLTSNATNTTDGTPALNWSVATEVNLVNYTLEVSSVESFATTNYTNYTTAHAAGVNQHTIDTLLPSNGLYFWRVIVWDTAGNKQTSETYQFTWDNETASLSAIIPTNNSWSTSANVAFNVTVTEDNVEDCILWLTNNSGEGWMANITNSTLVNNQFDVIATGLVDSEDPHYIWNAWCNDTSGNEAYLSTNYTLKVDATVPVLELQHPANNTVLGNTTALFEFNGSDTFLDNCTLYGNFSGTWVVNETNTSPVTKLYNRYTLTLAAGTYLWGGMCNDQAGNTVFTLNRTLFIDTAAPSIASSNISYWADPVVKTGGKLFVTVNTTDLTAQVINVTVHGQLLSTDYATDAPSRWWNETINITLVENGTLAIRTEDNNSNIGTGVTATVVIDNNAPSITPTYWTNGTTGAIPYTNGSAWYTDGLAINLTITEIGEASFDTLWYRNGSGGRWVNTTLNTSVNLTYGTQLFNNTFQFRANDTAGNMGQIETAIIKVDPELPVAASVNLVSTTVPIGGQSIPINANLSDGISGIDLSTAVAWHNGSTGSTAASPASLSLGGGLYSGTLVAPSAAGTYIVYVNVSDVAGNMVNSSGTVLTVSNATPTIVANVSSGSYIRNDTVVMFTIRNASWFYYNTTVSNTIFYNVSMTSGQVYQFNWTPKNSSGTTSDIYIYANNSDASNFQTNVTFRYYLDEVAPTTPLIYPQSLNNSAGSTINGTTTVTVGTSDSLSGVKDVRFYIAEQGNATVFNYSDTVAPYIWELDTHKFAEGNYTINVTVEDNVGLFNEISFVVIFNNTREATYTVTDNTLDLRETPFKNQIYQLTNLNSTTVDITVAKTALKTTITQLPTTYFYMNISGSTPQTSRVYFKLPTDTIATADFSRLYGFSDHNDDDSYEEGIPATYLNQVDDYYQFYFTTSGFSLFGIGLVAADAAESETSTSTSTSATQSTATVDTLDKKTSIWSEISTGESVSMNVGSSKIDISTITFMPKSDLTDVELVVKSYKEKPGAVSEVEGTVHQYMSIDAAGITDGDFDSATIEFRLTKDWLADNGLAAGDMALYRYSGGSWTKLDSSYDGEQGVYYTYSASTPGFSYFAVSGMPVTEEEVVEEVEVEEETPPVVEELPEEDDNIAGKAAEPSEAEEGKGKYFYILGILVILILVGYAFWKKKE